MAQYITAIRTKDGDKQIDYNALANKPSASDIGALPSSGGVMTGPITLQGNPTADMHAATKQYVDNAAAGLVTKIFEAGATAPTNTNLLWIDTNTKTGGLKYYNGTNWVHVPVSYT